MKQRLLALLRVPERPDPPPGGGEELETFRAARGFFHYSVLMWFPKQAAALAGLIFSLAFFGGIDDAALRFTRSEEWLKLAEELDRADVGLGWLNFDLAAIIMFFEGLAFVTWAGQLLFTGLLLKLSWELRWYLVGERSLRIRHGLWTVREQTMTIANIQNMVVRQGPLQRLLGFSDLEISTAGGGGRSGSGEDSTDTKNSFHVGRFRGLEDAAALRDKLRSRLQATRGNEPLGRAGGSGESREPSRETGAGQSEASWDDLTTAAQTLLAEARALRQEAETEG